MALYDNAKNLIDVGEIGNASTGDILFDGGEKINNNTTQIYNTFGDKRLASAETQYLHATGYYQKVARAIDMGGGLSPGAMIDVDTTAGYIPIVVRNGKVGEGVVIINSNGSLSSTDYIEIQVLDSFVSIPSGNLKVIAPYSRITIWCVSVTDGVARWDYSIESMFGDKSIPLDKTYQLSSTPREIPLFALGQYQTVKLLASAQSTDGRKYKISEIMLYVNQVSSQVISTEYAVLRGGQVNEEDEIYDLTFAISGNSVVATTSSTTPTLRLALKVISTQTFGVTN